MKVGRLRRLSTFLTAATLAFSLQVAAPVAATAQDNAAVAVNQKDGSSLFKFAFDVRRVMNGVVDQSNAAVAYSSCEECQTVAVAIQIVLVMSDPEVITPENVALAINYECTLCQTMALAYQIVIGSGEHVRFTGEGQKQLNQIRKAIRALLKSDASLEEIKAEIDALVAQLKDILATELVPVRPPEEDEDSDEDDAGDDEADDEGDDAGDEADDEIDDDDETDDETEPAESPEPTPAESSPSPDESSTATP